MIHRAGLFLLALLCLVQFGSERTDAQQFRVHQPGTPSPPIFASPGLPNRTINVQPGNPYALSNPPLVPVLPNSAVGGSSTLGIPSFDPYASSVPGSGASVYGATPYSPYAATPPPFSSPPPVYGSPPGIGVNPNPYGTPYGTSPFGASPFGASPATGSPNSLFPNGVWGNSGGYGADWGGALQLLQSPRIRHTFLYGDEGRDLMMNDTEVAVTAGFPNFAFSGQPVYVSPTFILHLWDGPQPPTNSHLPGNAYSAYLDTMWRSDPNQILGAELNGIVGVFTDFDTFTTDSLRLLGTALGTLRITPALQLKVGATYLDRVDKKLFPAGGFLWEPNPQTKFDIYFPKPKLSRYFATLGNTDVWWYLAGEYGGGSWTIEHITGTTDRIDINDIRVALGLDWLLHTGVKGFFEVGYVFDREVIYLSHPADNFKPRETFMLRGGLAY